MAGRMPARSRAARALWASVLSAVLIGLAWQVAHADGVASCLRGDLLILCDSPMPEWLMPVTLLTGLGLVWLSPWLAVEAKD